MQRTHLFSVLAVLFALTLCAQAQDPDLLAWWKLDDGKGTAAVDSSGNGHDGVLVQGPAWVAGKFGSGLLFDGQGGQRVSLGGLDIPAGQMTITCWCMANNLDTPGNDPRIVSKATGGANNEHWWMFSSGRISNAKYLRFRLKTNDGQDTLEMKAGTFEVGEWIHAAMWWDGTDMKLYKNGVEVGSMAKAGTSVALDPTIQAAIGNQPIGAENRPFDGIIDDVRIYTKALNAAELAEVMAGPPAPLAAGPNPADGTTLEQSWASLSWQSGTYAVSHDLYFGTDYDAVDQGAEGTFVGNVTTNLQVVGFPGFPAPEGLQPGTTYYWRVDEVNPGNPDSPWKGIVWSFTLPPKAAYNPIPADTMKFVETDADLTWKAAWGAALYSVYFGADRATIENATGAAAGGKMTFDPGPLEPDTTFYWRVDSFDGVSWTTGNVWSFTTAGSGGGLVGEYSHHDGGTPNPPQSAFDNIVMTRIDPGINFDWGNGSPEPGVVNENNFAVRWRGELEAPLTGSYTFIATTNDGVYLWVNGENMLYFWANQDGLVAQQGAIDLVAGEIVPIEMWFYAGTGAAKAELRWEHELIPRQIIPAAAFSPPLRASVTKPGNKALNVTQTPTLQWTAGEHAAEHDVYFGVEADAVAAADTSTAGVYQGRQAATSFSPAKLDWDTTYYWRVDEVNDTHPDSPWKGSVWSFTTADFLIVDDFESYDAYDSQIWWAWKDGLGYAAHDNEPAFGGNGTGSAVGDESTISFTEVVARHGGAQSMPFFYNNGLQGAKYSEAELTLTAARDWTEGGVAELSLWFHGDATNVADRLYVAVTDGAGLTVVVYHTDTSATTAGAWTEWVIPLQTLSSQGVNLTNVDRIALGVGTRGNATIPGGQGKMLFDDIRLYRP